MPCKYSQSDVVLSFFEASNLDMMLGHNLEPSQLLMYSPITVSEVRRSNGFCLANTETIICDSRLPDERPLSTDSATPEYEKRSIAVENRDSLLDLAGEDKSAPNPTIDISHITRTEPNPIMKPPRQGMAPEVYISKMTYLHMDAHETDILE
ncbi:PX domain-containing protein 1-like [Engraulis encrasicolus]|uniref:PX domain-containing protein 1-like n=1 Tax=Engraulis encrasicolus TaxID=184585 RepID=UPI002FD51F26